MNNFLPIGCLMPPILVLPMEMEEQLLKQQAAELELYVKQLQQNLIPIFKEILAVVCISYSLSYGFALLQNITLYVWVHSIDKIFSTHAQQYLITSFPLAFQNKKNCSSMSFEKLFPFTKPEEMTENIIKYFQKQNPQIPVPLLTQCLHSVIQIEKMQSLVPYFDCSIPSELLGDTLPLGEIRSQLIQFHKQNIVKYSAFYKIVNTLQLIKISLP